MDKVKILVVEDSLLAAKVIKQSLESSGYTVPAVTASGEDAIKKAEKHKPDLILMDIILNGKIDGVEAAEIIHSRFDIPVIYLSAFSDEKILERAKITEPFGYIIKPFKDRELRSTIEMAIYKHDMDKKLKKSEKQYETLIETISYGIQENNTSGIITFSNLAHAKMHGYERGELVGKAIWDFFASDEEKNHLKKYLKKLVKEQPAPTPYEVKNLTKDGKLIDVRVDWNYKRDEDGNLTGFISVISDITDHKHSEMALQKSREQLRAIIDSSTAVIYLKDIKGKYILINSRYEDLFHTTKEEMIGKTDIDIFPKDVAESLQYNDRKVLEKGNLIEFEECVPHDDGIHSYISIKFPLFDSSGKIYGVCGISTDITERKQAETALKQFSQKLVESQELERKRIASELHDSLAQNVMVISNEIQKILHDFPKITKVRESLSLASSLASQSVDEIDRIVNDLHPHQLDHLGLTKAIKWLVKNISKSSGINILAKINAVAAIPSETEIHIYRIIQEGISNIVKHSLASKGSIELKGSNKCVNILIADDGKGFQNNTRYTKNTIPRGFGLQGIEERAEICGGTLTIDSYSGKGTTLKISIPVKRKGK